MNCVYIEITDVCNLRCSFCPCGSREASTDFSQDIAVGSARRFMSPELFERSINEAAGLVDQVYFHVLGEPTLHPDFVLFLQKLERISDNRTDSKKLLLNLTTNGTTIDRCDKVILASPAIRQVNFSTHAYAELPFDVAALKLQNVLEFCQTALTERPDLYINLRLWNVGDCSSDSWNSYMLEQVNKAFGRNGTNENHNANENRAPVTLEHFCSRHKSFLVEGRIYIHQDSRFEWPNSAGSASTPTSSPTYPKGTCRALDTHCAILHDGRVVACCLDHSGQITLGRIQDNSLKQILQTPLAANIKEGFEQHELRHPFCQSCTFCKRFK